MFTFPRDVLRNAVGSWPPELVLARSLFTAEIESEIEVTKATMSLGAVPTVSTSDFSAASSWLRAGFRCERPSEQELSH